MAILLFALVVVFPQGAAADSQTWTSDSDWLSGTLDTNLVLQGTGPSAHLELRKDDNPEWMQMAPAVVPPSRYSYCLAWIDVDDSFLMFGGNGTSGLLGDTWKYSFPNDQWTRLDLATHPSNRSWVNCAYDPNEKVVVLFGGYTGSSWSTETWEFSAVTNTWSEIFPGGDAPTGLGTSPMTYDSLNQRIVMVASNHVYYEMETWAYDAVTDTWQNRMPSVYPPYRYSHAVGWDGTRTFLFSGNDGTQLICDYWTYDFYFNLWTQWGCADATHPSARWGHAMAPLAYCEGLLMFGGSEGTGYPPETWCYSNSWGWYTPPISGTPFGRIHLQLASSPSDGVAILFGGWASGQRKNDTWALALGYVINVDAVWTSSGTPVDTGCPNPTYDRMWWNRSANPFGTTMRFQIATSPSPSGPWTFTGPGGLPGTYYTTAGSQIDPSHNNRQYFRLLAKLRTGIGRVTPILEDLQASWSCPPTPPKITNTSPANARSNIPVDAPIWVNFSERMSTPTVTWTISGGVDAIASWSNSNKTLKLIPTTQFRDCVQYTVQITGGKDVNDGLDLVAGSAPNPWSFTTVCISPYVVTTDPPDGAMDVPLDQVVTVAFSEPMNGTTVAWTITSGIGLAGSWNANRDVLTLSHATSFQPCTLYTVEIASGEDDQGLPLVGGPVTNPWTFFTWCPNPFILTASPQNGTAGVALATPISVHFSRSMNPASVTYDIAPAVSSSTSWNSPANTTLTIIHPTDFIELTTYTVTITAGEDTGGAALVSGPLPNPWSFTTADAAPYVVSTSPVGGATVVPVGTGIVVTFSEPMATPTVSWTLSPTATLAYSWNSNPPVGTVLTLTPASPLTDCTQYTVRIATGTDLQGLPLVAGPVPNPWGFRVECPMGAPRGLQVVELPPDSVGLTWQPVARATSYKVYEAQDRFALFPSGWTLLGTTGQTQVSVGGHLTDGRTHFYVVRATDGFQDGPNSTMGVKGSMAFVFNPAGTNVNWLSLPYNTPYRRASDIANALGIGRIDVVGKWDPVLQSSIVYYYARGGWRGTDFPIVAGDGLYIGIVASFTWSVVGTDMDATRTFTMNPPAVPDVNWVGLPFTGIYGTASAIANELTSAKVAEIGLWDSATQSVLRWYWTGSAWAGTDFAIDPGAGVYIIISTTFSWTPILVIPVQP